MHHSPVILPRVTDRVEPDNGGQPRPEGRKTRSVWPKAAAGDDAAPAPCAKRKPKGPSEKPGKRLPRADDATTPESDAEHTPATEGDLGVPGGDPYGLGAARMVSGRSTRPVVAHDDPPAPTDPEPTTTSLTEGIRARLAAAAQPTSPTVRAPPNRAWRSRR